MVDEAVDVPDHERTLAEVQHPDGRVVVLLERIWAGKIAPDHPELVRRVGPSRWLLVVVSYEQEPGRIVTALATRKDPKRWQPSR